LLAVGFLCGSFVSVLTEQNLVDWRWFVPALATAIVGVGLARAGTRQETRHEGQLTANVDVLHSSIDRIVENMARLDAEKDGLHPFDVHGRIDELFPADLAAFVEARESIGHVYGLQAYAEVMNEFAAGERYLNRVWSASVDCYIDDVLEYIGRAREQFVRAQAVLRALGKR
jgi:hypothetical protein